MRKFLLLFLVLCCSSAVVLRAQEPRLSDDDRQKYLQEMRNLKHEFLTRELDLSRDQQNEFFPIYDEMEDQLYKIAEETRELEAKVTKDSKASDIEIESASRAIFEQKVREGNIEMEYFEKFKNILKPRQLLSLKNAERKFTQQLVRKHRKMGNTPAR